MEGPVPEESSRPRIRRAVEEDAQGVLQLSLDAIRITAAGHYSPEQLSAWAASRTHEGHLRMIRTTRVLVAELQDELAGFASLDTATGTVDQLFVAPHRGGLGIASTLLARIDDEAVGAGLTQLRARASKRAIAVFKRRGYTRVRTEQATLGDQVLERYEVHKSLQRASP
jgi:putative acetyltransferase